MLPKKIYLNYIEEDDKDKTWSDQPVSVADYEMQNREYTDLSQVWHGVDIEPCPYKNLFTEDANNSYVVRQWANEGYGWSYFAELLKLKRWAYINDLLPKGGEL